MTSSPWDELLSAALLGTARRPFELPQTGGPLGELLAGIDRQDPAAALLSAAAATALFQAAGRLPVIADAAPPAPAPADAHLAVAAPAGHSLPMIAEFPPEMRRPLLQEWLDTLAALGRLVPPVHLPLLLNYAIVEPAARPQLLSIIGERGRWLAQLNPDWHCVLSAEPPADPAELEARWPEGSRAERLAWLRQLRALDPPRGLALLTSTWKQERAAERAALLAELATGLSMADEPFLEQTLDDRSKEVCATATDLLLQLPDSQLRRRSRERTAALLEWQPARLLGKARLVVTPPLELDAIAIRDGIAVEPQQGYARRAWWLLQMIERVPPTEWCRRWHVTPHELLSAEITQEWHNVLIEGWERATVRFDVQEWVQPLLKRWLAQGSEHKHNAPAALLELLPPAEREAFILEVLNRKREPLHHDHPALPLFASCRHRWSRDFSLAVLENLARRFAMKGAYKQVWGLQNMVTEAGLRMAPEISCEALEFAERTAQRAEGNTYYLVKLLRQLTDVLSFRREMLEELHR
jgi:hypothetical protein